MKGFLISCGVFLLLGCGGAQQQVQNKSPLEERYEEYLSLKKEADAKKYEAEKAQNTLDQKKSGLASALRQEAAKKRGQAKVLEDEAENLVPIQKVEIPEDPKPDHFVDIEVSSWDLSGIKRLSSYPPGWSLDVDGKKEIIFVLVNDQKKFEISKPKSFKGPTCYRIRLGKIQFCPVVLK